LNFLRDGAGFMLPNDSYELLALLELAGNLSMPELVTVIFDHPAACSESTATKDWPMCPGTTSECSAGQISVHCCHCSLGDEVVFETCSTFPDDDYESKSELSDCSEECIGGCSKASSSVSKATLFMRPGALFPSDDLEKGSVRRQWTLQKS